MESTQQNPETNVFSLWMSNMPNFKAPPVSLKTQVGCEQHKAISLLVFLMYKMKFRRHNSHMKFPSWELLR